MVFPDHTGLLFLISAVGSVKQNLSGKESDKVLSCGCYHDLPLPHRALTSLFDGWKDKYTTLLLRSILDQFDGKCLW